MFKQKISPGAWALLLMAALSQGCAGPSPVRSDMDLYAIRFNEDGRGVDPRCGCVMDAAQMQAQFNRIFAAIDNDRASNPKRQILIFIHGGLTTPDDAIQRAAGKIETIKAANYYPIFVIWDSRLQTTYWEHLLKVRQGQKNPEVQRVAAFTWPIYLFSDFLRAIARAPTVWLGQGSIDNEALGAALDSIFNQTPSTHSMPTTQAAYRVYPEHAEAWMSRPRNVNVLTFYLELNDEYARDWAAPGHHRGSHIAISLGKDDSQPGDWINRGVSYTLTIPSKLFTSPIIDALGSSAWDDMSRRTQTIIEGANDFIVRSNTTPGQIKSYIDRGTTGGLESFMDELAEHCNSAGAGPGATTRPYAITLVGHSMGTMIIDEILRRQTARETQTAEDLKPTPLPVANVVYMGAACTIRDFRGSVIPFMEQKSHADVRFFDLCLHPTAELIETNDLDIPPRGSLLCWIDDFLSNPSTPMERTFGRWENLLNVPYIFPVQLRGRVNIKAFSLAPHSSPTKDGLILEPQHHGDFSSGPYWDESFWTPAPPEAPGMGRNAAARIKRQQMLRKIPADNQP